MQKEGNEFEYLDFKTEKEFLMYYHTTLRNVGLFTSVAVAALSVSRLFGFGRGKFKWNINNFYAATIHILAIVFLLMSIQICRLLIKDVRNIRRKTKDEDIYQWSLIPYTIITINAIFIILSLGSGLTSYLK
jgi:hypothetical protein